MKVSSSTQIDIDLPEVKSDRTMSVSKSQVAFGSNCERDLSFDK